MVRFLKGLLNSFLLFSYCKETHPFGKELGKTGKSQEKIIFLSSDVSTQSDNNL